MWVILNNSLMKKSYISVPWVSQMWKVCTKIKIHLYNCLFDSIYYQFFKWEIMDWIDLIQFYIWKFEIVKTTLKIDQFQPF